MEPTERQMSRAHAAFEAMSKEWTMRKVDNYGLAPDRYVLEHSPPYDVAKATEAVDGVAAHVFDGPDAREKALFFKRDKVLREVLRAVLIMDQA